MLDEPTAALDPVSEYEVYSKFNELSGERTAIYISHRLASCRFCDNIIVFDAGRIVQYGTHKAPLEEEGGASPTFSGINKICINSATLEYFSCPLILQQILFQVVV